jgi:cell division protein FtsB
VRVRRTWLLVAFALGFGVLFVFTGWRLANVASTVLLVAVGVGRASKPPRVDARQAQRLAEIAEREARLKRERPGDYPPVPWLAD